MGLVAIVAGYGYALGRSPLVLSGRALLVARRLWNPFSRNLMSTRSRTGAVTCGQMESVRSGRLTAGKNASGRAVERARGRPQIEDSTTRECSDRSRGVKVGVDCV